MALVAWRRNRGVDLSSALVRMEGHGREETLIPGADLSRTVGWFTSAYPVRTDLAGIDLADAFAGGAAAGEAIKAVKEQLLAIPDRGMGYGLLRHFNPEGAVLAELAAGAGQFQLPGPGRWHRGAGGAGRYRVGTVGGVGGVDLARSSRPFRRMR